MYVCANVCMYVCVYDCIYAVCCICTCVLCTHMYAYAWKYDARAENTCVYFVYMDTNKNTQNV